MAQILGPIFDPAHPETFGKAVARALKPDAQKLVAAVQAKAPVSKKPRDGKPPGELARRIKARTTSSKRKVTITLTLDAKSKAGFPYAAAQNAKGPNAGFIDNVIAEAADGIVGRFVAITGELIDQMNGGETPT